MRLVTRSDFDGLVTAVLLRKLGMIDEMKFVHPKDMQDGTIEITKNDILTNIPFVPGCGLWFDHHASELKRSQEEKFEFEGEIRIADSAARVVYEYYGGRDKFGPFFDSMMEGVDKADAAKFNKDDILKPEGWDLLSFIMDSRTGLGRYRDFRISNYQLMEKLVGLCLEQPLEQIMQDEDVKQRVDRYFELDALFREMLAERTRIEGHAIVTDLRGVEQIYPGNRFLIYALFPEQNVSLWIVDGFQKQNCAIACGHSILNRTCEVPVGYLMREFGGGGHEAAGTCQVPYAEADATIAEIIKRFN
ncbi:nanoRNase/pAp phosphatase (c-di-AMP/oligoRNAs hydrolase) [Paenibacillus taihuensis]|uniref:NanoRNase/pAp phosphatase (C-di-AMP/oligoRNAs hydrolase) n=1 Tax=Paenibacillus taihuensis TaxID=1156355 RepID=A0A3D9RU05_9BACL|nr:exopolyphosphatase [Paenibacillus taihuensis]REE80192.1 nanoRNase/pAp phosphatase (c-di-AMP/oligoRNAs hydrolase) [Paenibacillus taihuensis]